MRGYEATAEMTNLTILGAKYSHVSLGCAHPGCFPGMNGRV